MSNQEIADHFDLLSKLMDIHGENSFKVKTYSIAAFRIEKIADRVALMSEEQLASIPNVGAAVVQKITTLLSTGKLPVLEEYLAKTPAGVVEMLEVKGIGPKKIALLWKELGIESLGELEYACNENRLLELKGFGIKTQEAILKSIAFIRSAQGFFLWSDAELYAQQVLQKMQTVYPAARLSFSGAYRRQLTTLSTIDFHTDLSISEIKAVMGLIPEVVFEENENQLHVQIARVPKMVFYLSNTAQFEEDLFFHSASAEFLAAFQEQYEFPDQTNEEEAIFTHNSLEYIPAPLRETAAILAVAARHELPSVVQAHEIKGIIHSHSTYSDGIHTLAQMAEATRAKGYEYLVISDHSKTAAYAGGLSVAEIRAQHEEIDRLNSQMAPFKIFKSIESDILGDGSLDYEPEVLAGFDLVIASIHSNLKMNREKAMQRLLKAIEHPYTTILGHPTGRLLLSRDGYPVDHKMLIDACAAHQVVLEINAHPRRLDVDWSWIPYALEKGVCLSINPDAHSTEGIDLVKYGVLAAQKGGLTKQHNLSSFSLSAFEQFIRLNRRW